LSDAVSAECGRREANGSWTTMRAWEASAKRVKSGRTPSGTVRLLRRGAAVVRIAVVGVGDPRGVWGGRAERFSAS